MYPFLTPEQMISLSIRTSLMLAEAQMVIGMRLMAMIGVWRVLPAENARMSSEKLSDVGEAAMTTSRAMLTGKPPAHVAEAALTPISRRTSANVKRLARRGPGKP